MAITRADTRLTDAMVEKYVSAGCWNVATFPETLEENARIYGDEIALIDGRTQLSWGELWRRARNLALHLVRLGVARGDVVGLQLPNRVEFVVALAAINLAGAIACPYLPLLRRSEIDFILRFSEAVATIVPQGQAGEFDLVGLTRELRDGLSHLKTIIVVGAESAPQGTLLIDDLVAMAPDGVDEESVLRDRRPVPQDVCRLLFTSGSTGDPKGVLHTYDTSVYNNIRQNEQMKIDERSVILLFLPLALNLGMFHVMQAALARCCLVLMEQFKPAQVLEAIERHRVTYFASPPTGLIAILREASLANSNLSSLRCVISVGAPCAIDFLLELRARLGCPVLEGYGMTEAGWISITDVSDRPEDSVGTVGFPSPWMFVRVQDEGGRETPPGTAGEITIDGPCVCVGYFRSPARNAESWTEDGRFRTGDLGVIDDKGRLRIVGRAKDVIKHGGASVYPRELEDLILLHPAVSDVAIIGVPDSYFGENICACVVLKSGATLSLEELIEFLRERVAKFKLPQRLELFDRLPYTSTGKVQKQVLRDELGRQDSETGSPRRSARQ